ncbi:hypothetical protein AZE42_11226 [Rhizopogon vesiculosus]|uniref:Uncharacterized protein n=1 Tax=Rhizopogon vesiculosus TaxID=180088 RepID=A0A1J8PJY1_9AGAM|nr:hypothetical protein AZE42_11226 [Rhizopogon vesiculosus]
MKINLLALVPIRIDRSTLTASVDVDDNSILEYIGNFLVSRLQIEYESKKQKIHFLDRDNTDILVFFAIKVFRSKSTQWPTNIQHQPSPETKAGDRSKEDLDAWLDNSTIDFSDSEDESDYKRCSTPVFLGSEDARLELLDLFHDRLIVIGAQNKS